MVLVAYRAFVPPTAPSDLLHPAWGAFLALASCAGILGGGIIAQAEEARSGRVELSWSQDAWAAPAAPQTFSPATSIAPPQDRAAGV